MLSIKHKTYATVEMITSSLFNGSCLLNDFVAGFNLDHRRCPSATVPGGRGAFRQGFMPLQNPPNAEDVRKIIEERLRALDALRGARTSPEQAAFLPQSATRAAFSSSSPGACSPDAPYRQP